MQPEKPTSAEDRIALPGYPSSYTAALETRARALAADKMGLVNDPDGDRVPAELWRQCLPQARADLPMGSHYEAEDVVNDPRVLATYAAAEWSELGDDGKAWTTKLVEVAQERALSRPAAGDAALADVDRLSRHDVRRLVEQAQQARSAWRECSVTNRVAAHVFEHRDAEARDAILSAFSTQAATIATLRAQLDTERREGERLRKLVEVPEDGLVGGNPSGVYDMNDLLAAYRKGWKERGLLASSSAARNADASAPAQTVDDGGER